MSLLSAYILAGTSIVPFHGDESTTIWMSRDYAYTFITPDFDQIRYIDPPLRTTEQHMRLITGNLMKYAMGVSWSANGVASEQINEQWDWGADWQYNQQNGHAPDDSLLMYGRWPSAVMLALGASVLFVIGLYIGGRPVAYLASLYYFLNPALLLNGRRAMFEGGLILFILLVVLAGIWLLRYRAWWAALLLGVLSGLAVSAKHPAVFTVVVVFVVCGVFALLQAERRLQSLNKLIAAGLISLCVFYVTNPVWWGDPVTRVGQVIDARSGILEGQVAAFGGYDTFTDQLTGFARQTFIVSPQYYEVGIWQTYIADQIQRYESSWWAGVSIGGSTIGAVLVVTLVIIGFAALWPDRRIETPTRWLIGAWCITMFLVTALITPLEWQRYYLMAHPAVGLLLACGVVWAFNQLKRLWGQA